MEVLSLLLPFHTFVALFSYFSLFVHKTKTSSHWEIFSTYLIFCFFHYWNEIWFRDINRSYFKRVNWFRTKFVTLIYVKLNQFQTISTSFTLGSRGHKLERSLSSSEPFFLLFFQGDESA